MWVELLTRSNVDMTTISGIDVVFFKLIKKFYKKEEESFFTYFSKNSFTHYTNLDVYTWGKNVYEELFNTPKKILYHYKTGKNILKSIQVKTKEYEKVIGDNPNINNILLAYKEFEKQFKKINYIYSIASWLAIESWQKDYELIISRLIDMNGNKNIIKLAYSSWRPSAINKLQLLLNNGGDEDKLLEKYQYLRSWSLIWNEPLDKNWIKGIKGKIDINNKFRLHSAEKLIRVLKPNLSDRKMLIIAPYIIFFKDWRDELRRFFCFKWVFLFKEIGIFFDLDYKDIGYLTLDEIEDSLRKKQIDKKTISLRKKSFSIVSEAGKQGVRIYSSNKMPLKYLNIINKSKNPIAISVIGKIGNRGEVQGKARIINSFADARKFKKGEILIANTTHPNYLAIMKQASAFVTNEGGVISHAAIIARELNKPCIVGTKNATLVFKNGDIVKVNANKGEVKKIINLGNK